MFSKLKGSQMKKTFAVLSMAALSLVASTSVSFAEGDAVKGEKVFKKCKACHTVTDGGRHLVGPNLYNIVGKAAASAEGYKYSKAMKASGLTWDEETLDKYLLKPKGLVKKTKMSFRGLKKEKDRNNVIAYLKTLK